MSCTTPSGKTKFNAYMEAKGQPARVNCSMKLGPGTPQQKKPALQKVMAAYRLFETAYEEKGRIPKQKEPRIGLAEWVVLQIDNHEAGKSRSGFPLDKAPWPVLTALLNPRLSLREAYNMNNGHGDVIPRDRYMINAATTAELKAVDVRPFPYAEGTWYMIKKHGGACGTRAMLAANQNKAYGLPSSPVGEIGHASWVEFAYFKNGDRFKMRFEGGGHNPATLSIHLALPISRGRDQERASNWGAFLDAIQGKGGVPSYMESMMAYYTIQSLTPDERAKYGAQLKADAMAINPGNICLSGTIAHNTAQSVADRKKERWRKTTCRRTSSQATWKKVKTGEGTETDEDALHLQHPVAGRREHRAGGGQSRAGDRPGGATVAGRRRQRRHRRRADRPCRHGRASAASNGGTAASRLACHGSGRSRPSSSATGPPARRRLCFGSRTSRSRPARMSSRSNRTRVDITADGATIAGHNRAGIYCGTRSLLQMLAAGKTLPCGRIVDGPITRYRMLMLDVGRKAFPIETLYDYLRILGWYKMNVLHLHLSDGSFDNRYGGFRVQCDTFSGLASKDCFYTKQQLREFQDRAAAMGIMVLPEIDMPGHAAPFTMYWPELAWRQNPYCGNLDVTNPETVAAHEAGARRDDSDLRRAVFPHRHGRIPRAVQGRRGTAADGRGIPQLHQHDERAHPFEGQGMRRLGRLGTRQERHRDRPDRRRGHVVGHFRHQRLHPARPQSHQLEPGRDLSDHRPPDLRRQQCRHLQQVEAELSSAR